MLVDLSAPPLLRTVHAVRASCRLIRRHVVFGHGEIAARHPPQQPGNARRLRVRRDKLREFAPLTFGLVSRIYG